MSKEMKKKKTKSVSKSKAKKLKGGSETFDAGPVGIVTCGAGGCNPGTAKTRCYSGYDE